MPERAVPEQSDFNPRSPCGERLFTSRRIHRAWRISIHAPRAGSDKKVSFLVQHDRDFNPRSPCGERQMPPFCHIRKLEISIHAPRAGSDGHIAFNAAHVVGISIHAPRAGSDGFAPAKKRYADIFQSTLPVRGATDGQKKRVCGNPISIHAPRAGSDSFTTAGHSAEDANFNPRSPCGERPDRPNRSPCRTSFQSTLPVRGATAILHKSPTIGRQYCDMASKRFLRRRRKNRCQPTKNFF